MLFTFVFAVSFLCGCDFVWLGCSAFVVFVDYLVEMFDFKSKAVRVLFRNLLIVVTVIVVVIMMHLIFLVETTFRIRMAIWCHLQFLLQ